MTMIGEEYGGTVDRPDGRVYEIGWGGTRGYQLGTLALEARFPYLGGHYAEGGYDQELVSAAWLLARIIMAELRHINRALTDEDVDGLVRAAWDHLNDGELL